MDPINPIAGNPEAVNLADPERPKGVEGQTPKDPHGITIAAMAIFILLSLAAVAFFYYQNQQLKSMLASYQQVQVSPTPSATTDPTASWKTYTNIVMGFSVKLPPSWFTHKETKTLYGYSTNISYPVDNSSSQDFISGQQANVDIARSNNNGEDLEKIAQDKVSMPASPFSNTITNSNVGSQNAIILTDTSGNGKSVLINFGKYNYDISIFNPDKFEGINTTFDQVLSTFKFISPTSSPSASPVACTQEAKLCPNGTSVGRTGPNCEFAPCPTP